ncbi:unnamed protein product [Polarella glacialis]|uniref:Uncharacterized protein n=1 Tax=Polarella glacialis TaxID=89957 RepID=A0A813LNL7_POLGL|nr:unnamed protein product [Polarella glacialis]
MLASVISCFRRFGLAYDRRLGAHPVVTKAITGGFLAFLGDFQAQQIEKRRNNGAFSWQHLELNAQRSAAFTSLSTFWTGLVNPVWYGILERWLPQAGGWLTVLPKVAASQLIANPFFYMPTFYLWTGLILGRTLDESITKARREYWDTLLACWAVMGTANIFMFWLIPVHYQAVFAALATFCVNLVLSLISNADQCAENMTEMRIDT